MTKRVSSLFLAIVMLLQMVVPQTAIAKEGAKAPSDNLVKVGMINGNSYDSKLMLELNRQTAKNRKKRAADPGIRLFGYFEEDQEPKDADKLKYHGEVKAKLSVKGLDGGEFPWKKIFGKEEVHLRFIQTNDETGVETGTERVLNISQAGEYTWTDGEGNPAELPLFNNNLEPLIYEVKLDEEVSDKVKLLTARLTTTDNASPTFDRPDADGRIKYHLTLEIGLQQVASSKFVSEWHTAVGETERPQLQGTMTGSMDNGKSKTIDFNLPKKNDDEVIVRTASRRDKNKLTPEFLYKKPTVKLVETSANGLTFEEKDGVKTVKLGDHKYKYDFKYDVIKGGKLTMTEVIPVTFDANGGKFASIEEGKDQKIVKEVEYDGTLTDKAENPKKDRETFKGWSTTEDGKNPITDKDLKNIKEAKTFYAIWANNEIKAEELTVHESFKDGETWVNIFIPTLDQLKEQVKIKDANGTPQALANDDTFEILDDSGNAITGVALKTALYDKLKEKANPNDEPTRVEKVKAKVTFKNGEVQTVDIPLKVYKNIYKADTKGEKPSYVPKDYVKVTLDPTKKATDSQKTYYYVNPAAKVVIPGTDPTGTGDNKFIKWTSLVDGSAAGTKPSDFDLAKRHQFEKATTITAQYVSDVIPAKDDGNKAEGTPDNFVKVTFVPTDKATDNTEKIFYVNPEKEVTIPMTDPKGATYFTFKEWKIGDAKTGETYTVGTPKKFTAQETTITATYTERDKIIPFNPDDADPMARPDGYVKVTFKAETGLKFKDSKAYYVKKDAGVTLKTIKDDTTKGYPAFDVVKGYKFDKWDKEDTEIKDQDIVVTAKATPLSDVIEKKDGETKPQGYVEVKFVPTDKATEETKAEKIYWVNPEKAVTIPVANPVGKQYFTFKEWKVGADASGDKYVPTTAKKFTEATTITATYTEADNIIPYDPTNFNDPKIVRPDGYVRVTFEVETGLKLTENKAYYVKQNAKDAQGQPLTLGNAELAKPGVSAETGYKFENKWKPADTTKIETTDIVVKAKATPIPDTVEKKNGEEKPAGYVEVKFVAGENGQLTENNANITEKVYYVNPNKYVTITPPTAVGNTGYEFGSWDKDAKIPTQYKVQSTTIKASFNQLKDVVPKTKDNDSEKPAGYKTVTFVIEGEGGSIVNGQTTVYYVDPNRAVTIKPPTTLAETGYAFEKWDQDTVKTAKQYSKDTTVKGNFKKLEDIIPSTKDDNTPNAKPDGYITVTFDKGEHGTKIEGQTVYYVNPTAGKKLSDITTKPTVTPETGWKVNGWDKEETTELKGPGDVLVKAQYKAYDDVIPKTTNDESEKPEGYFTVTFKSTDKGSIGSTVDGTKVVYVNPNKAVVLKDKAPAVTGIPGYQFAGWDVSIDQAIQYKDKTVITAQYNKSEDISKVQVPGYVKVEFKSETKGTLSGTTEYWIKPGVEVNIPAPTVTPNVGYAFKEWDNPLTVTRQAGAETYTITATYKEEKAVIPKTKTDNSEKPNGYVTVTFDKGDHGALSGQTIYFVNPNKKVTLTAPTVTADLGFKQKANDAAWDHALEGTFAVDTTIKAQYESIAEVVPETNDNGTKNEQPKGYVTVKLIPTDKATAETKAEKIYFVNPTKKVTITNTPVGTKVTDANNITCEYTFKGWTVTKGTIGSWTGGNIAGTFIQDTEITALYLLKYVDVMPLPLAEDKVVTPIGDTPDVNTLVKNKDKLPDGTTFKYTDDGTPDVKTRGKTTATVEVKYPNGKTTIVKVPITVVDNVVPQFGGESGTTPLVPASYVKVTVDTTDKATNNTMFKKVFWVKPNVEVTIPDILAPTGKEETIDGVNKTNNFVAWKLKGSDPAKTYKEGITDTFKEKDNTIVATYEYGKNVEPVGKDNPWIPQGSEPLPKDFIDNPYDDGNPDKPNTLPPGTKLEFVPGKGPTTDKPGTYETTIKITYPNKEVKELKVKYRVPGDVVEQPNPNDPTTKPAVPENFVEVIVKTTDKATEDVTRTFWVNPEKKVIIPVDNPQGGVMKDAQGNPVKDPAGNERHWIFTKWDKPLQGVFKTKTTITAQYAESELTPIEPIPEAQGDFIYTPHGKAITKDQYEKAVKLPQGYSFTTGTKLTIEPTTAPDVNKSGRYSVKGWVTYPDGKEQMVTITVVVGDPIPTPQPDPIPQPYPTPQPNFVPYPVPGETKTVYKDRTVLRREVRYMQGFEGKFRPDDGLTRAEAAQILANALKEDGYPFDLRYKLPYKDTTKEMWYNDAVRITTQADVFIGYDDGEFKPQRKITRAEWIATLRRFQYVDKVGGNSLHMRKNHWAIPEVEAAYRSGWLSIYTEKKAPFNYDEPISRKEVAAVSNRAFRRVRDMDYIRRNDKFMINYTDINRDMWAYDDILCASNTFLHQRQGAYIAYKRGDKAYTIDVKDAIIEQDLFQRIPRHR